MRTFTIEVSNICISNEEIRYHCYGGLLVKSLMELFYLLYLNGKDIDTYDAKSQKSFFRKLQIKTGINVKTYPENDLKNENA